MASMAVRHRWRCISIQLGDMTCQWVTLDKSANGWRPLHTITKTARIMTPWRMKAHSGRV